MNSDIDVFNSVIKSTADYIGPDISENAASVLEDSLQIIYANRDKLLEQNKTASDAGTPKAEDEKVTISSKDYTSSNELSIGQMVHTRDGDGMIIEPPDNDHETYLVGLGGRVVGEYKESDLIQF